MRTLALNSKNIVAGTGNSQLQYDFPSGSITLNDGDQLALSSVSMYNSVYNFTAALNNSTFTYTWIDGTEVTVTIPDSFLDVDGLNDYLHQVMLNKGHYLIEDATGNFVWFITIQINVSIYAIQIQCYPMNAATYPTATGATKKYTIPSGSGAAWVPQTANITPYITIPETNIRTTLGFNAGYYAGELFGGSSPNYAKINTISGTSPNKTQVTTYSAIQTMTSQNTPQITALTSYLITCSLINNNYSIPNTLLSSFPPSAAFAEQFVFSATGQLCFIDCQPGSYSSFTVQFFDQNLRQIVMQDPQIVVLLVIRNKDERA
jgi:hypothetical protein